MLDELTAMAVKSVVGLRDGEIALSDAVLAVEEFANDTVGTGGGSTIGSEGELAVMCQSARVQREQVKRDLTREACRGRQPEPWRPGRRGRGCDA